MRPAKLHELRLPSKYALWRKYIWGTELQNRIGPERFTQFLTQRGAIELVSWKGAVKCKTLNEALIKTILIELSNAPFKSWFSVLFYRLVKRRPNAI